MTFITDRYSIQEDSYTVYSCHFIIHCIFIEGTGRRDESWSLSVPGAYDLSSASLDRFGTGLTWWSSSRAWRSSSSWGQSDFRASSLFALAGTHASCPSRLRSKTTARLAHCQTDVRWTPGSFSDSEDRGEWRRKGDHVSLKLRSMGDFVYDTLHTFTSTTINH